MIKGTYKIKKQRLKSLYDTNWDWLDVGHNCRRGDKIWFWDGLNFIVRQAVKNKFHCDYPTTRHTDNPVLGRYDIKKNIVTICLYNRKLPSHVRRSIERRWPTAELLYI